ncbi:MAG: precorrin-6A/cobalt-precorrin-6A reductase [Clostridia bacterium]
MCKLLLFAGTTEGRLLYERLSARGIEMDISVATEYGKELVELRADGSTPAACRRRRWKVPSVQAAIRLSLMRRTPMPTL